MKKTCILIVSVILVITICETYSFANMINLEFVTVGNPNNQPDTRYGSYGSVNYTYKINKFEITNGQYCEFLNAVAQIDTYTLWNIYYWSGPIRRTTEANGEYSYTIPDTNWINRPMKAQCTWANALRYCNWLTNGKPTGNQNLSTTEDGSYYINGAITVATLNAVTRKIDARYVMANKDEWHKAAYYDPNKPGGSGYWDYPTRSDVPPSNELSSTGTNNANYLYSANSEYPYILTIVGFYAASPAYGTLDQGGNAWEWIETPPSLNSGRCTTLGGSCSLDVTWLKADSSSSLMCSEGSANEGLTFRVVELIQPTNRSDLNRDNIIDSLDLSIMVNQWMQPPHYPSADISPQSTGDGIVNLHDFAVFAKEWMKGM